MCKILQKSYLLNADLLTTIKKRRVSAIIIALNAFNELVSLTKKFTPVELASLKYKHRYFCPGCGSELTLKAGEVKIPHFAHRSLADCDSFSEPETLLHLHGKLQLHQFFIQRNLSSELEKYLPSIKQRADLLIGNHTAIEFQCSAIPSSQIRSRSKGYRSIGIEPIWILKTRFSSCDSVQYIRLKHFERHMIQRENGVDYLMFFCPETNRFIYASSLFWLGGNRWAAKMKSLPAEAQGFPFAVPKKLTFEEYKAVFQLCIAQRDSFIRAQQFAKNRYRNRYWILTYELQLNCYAIPAFIGVPFASAQLIDEQPIIWQMHVIKSIKDEVPLESLLTGNTIKLLSGTSNWQALMLLEGYADIYRMMCDEKAGTGKLLEVLYANYCNGG